MHRAESAVRCLYCGRFLLRSWLWADAICYRCGTDQAHWLEPCRCLWCIEGQESFRIGVRDGPTHGFPFKGHGRWWDSLTSEQLLSVDDGSRRGG